MITQTLRLLIGGKDCNASCPYCIVKMFKSYCKEPEINWRRFDIAANYAKSTGTTNILIGSTGETSLYPRQITNFLEKLKPYNFPLIELQTNGIMLAEESYKKYLKSWIKQGLSTIQLSIVSSDSDINSKVMRAKKYDLPNLIENLRGYGYSVRLSCVMFKGGIDSAQSLEDLIIFSKNNKVDQLTVKPVTKPDNPFGSITNWVNEHKLSREDKDNITEYLESKGARLLKLAYGGMVYDVFGQNVAFTEAFPFKPDEDDLRQLVLFPNGRINYDRMFRGAVLL